MSEGGRGCADTSSPVPGGSQVSSCHEGVQTICAFVIFLLYVSDRGSSLDVPSPALLSAALDSACSWTT